MLSDDQEWQEALHKCTQEGFRVASLDASKTPQLLRELVGEEPPPPVETFVRGWVEGRYSPWEALARSVELANPDVVGRAVASPVLRQLQRLVNHCERAAIVFGTSMTWRSPSPWAYLLQLRRNPSSPAGYVRLYLPATPSAVSEAEAVLGMRLPPSYVDLLEVTSGLGLDETAWKEIVGAGPQRAAWDVVVAGDWRQCSYYQEIAARWRQFQGIYSSEREEDARRGTSTFRSDERILLPFMGTYGGDDWCFDRSRQGVDGECLVVYWDHELREADDAYASFAEWMGNELEREVFPDNS